MWFSFARKTKRKQVARSARGTFRPCLEGLEDRCLLSAGTLDPTFGNGAGYVTTSTSAFGSGAPAALIQPNGDIVALGGTLTAPSGAYDFSAERYNPDGSLDASFGSGGIALTSFGSGVARGPYAALYPAGSANAGDIIQEGTFGPASNPGQYQALARYTPNGSLDPTFGAGGEVLTAFPGLSLFPGKNGGGIVVTGNGQIVALSVDQTTHFVLARYNVDGSLDTTFGQGGYVTTTVPAFYQVPSLSDLLQQPDGTLIVTACTNTGGAGSGGIWDLYGFNANGTPNTSFGNQGIVTTATPGGPGAAALYFNAGPTNDGQIVVIGGPDFGTKDLVRYNANGSLDTTFGTGGLMPTPVTFNPVTAFVDASGRTIVAGRDYVNFIAIHVARFNVNGTADTSFGSGGLVSTAFGTSSEGDGLAIYPSIGAATDGDIVVTGNSASSSGIASVLVARYLGQATSPYFVITGSSNVTAGNTSTFTISVLNPDGTADTGYSGTVQVTSGDPLAVLPGSVTITSGTGSFSVTLETAGTQSVAAAELSNPAITGSDTGIAVSPAKASQVLFSQAPSSGTAGQTLRTVQVAIEDAYGNVETGDNSDKIMVSVSSGPSTQMGGTLAETVQAGIAVFSNLQLNTSGNYTLAALASLAGGGTLGPAVSSGISVASPVSLAFGNITYNSRTGLYSETVTFTNTSGGTLTGPIALDLTGLPSGVTLTNAKGKTSGNPYIEFLTAGKTLKKGVSVSITLTFSAPSLGSIAFGSEVVVGL
jgi:uncharacterized delta-60 repeat protein